MSRLGCFTLIAGLVAVASVASVASVAAADDGVRKYTTQQGDSCLAIAARELGSAAAYKTIHTLNPWLGPEPHNLRPGLVMVLPPLLPDAEIAGTLGNVAFRKPEQSLWSAAARGVDLFRAWRVKTEPRAAASVAFPDKSELMLREESVLIVYGPTKDRTKTIRARAELKNGSLQTRLADLDARPVVIATEAGEAEMQAGSAVVRLDAAGSQVVSNLRGKQTVVRGLKAAAKPGGTGKLTAAVAVPAGMGTKVVRGQAPSKPRPLPAAPTIKASSSALVFALEGVGAIHIGWDAVPSATHYLASVSHHDSPAPVAMATLSGSTTSWRPIVDSAGDYQVNISTIDAEGFESGVATSTFTFVVVKGDTAVALQNHQRGYAVGTVLSVNDWGCRQNSGDQFRDAVILSRPGDQEITCADATGRTAAFVVPVFPIQLELSAAQFRAGELGEIRIALPSPDLRYEALASPGLTLLPSANPRRLSFRVNSAARRSESIQMTRSGVVIAIVEVPIAAAR